MNDAAKTTTEMKSCSVFIHVEALNQHGRAYAVFSNSLTQKEKSLPGGLSE